MFCHRGNADEYLAQQQDFSQHPQEGYGYNPGMDQYPGGGFYQQRGHGVQHPQGPDRQPAYGLPHHLHNRHQYGPQQNYGPEINYRPQQNYGPEQNYRPQQNYGPEPNYGPQQNYAPQYNHGMPSQHGSPQQPGQRQQDHRPRGQGPRTPRGNRDNIQILKNLNNVTINCVINTELTVLTLFEFCQFEFIFKFTKMCFLLFSTFKNCFNLGFWCMGRGHFR